MDRAAGAAYSAEDAPIDGLSVGALVAGCLLYVPTHRRCLAAIESYAGECLALERERGEEIPFLVIESFPAGWIAEHAALLRRLSAECSVTAYHLVPEGRAEYVRAVVEAAVTESADRERLVRLLVSERVSYGAGPNLAALAAAALGARVLLRRDSDTLPMRFDGVPSYPGELELRALQEPQVFFVASTCVGDPPLDRRDLLAAGAEFIRRIERTVKPQLSDQEIDELVHDYLVAEPTRSYFDDFVTADRAGSVEMGVSGVRDVFRAVPEMPLTETLGSDFMQRNLLLAVRFPVLFHSRKVRHSYDEARRERLDPSAAVGYTLQDLRYLLFWRIWADQAEQIAARPRDFWRPPEAPDAWLLAESAARAVSRQAPHLRVVVEEFAAAHLEAADAMAADGAVAARLRMTGRAALAGADRHIAEVTRGFADYCFLLRHWTALITAASQSAELLGTLAMVKENPTV
ncbi:hypothetical protein SAMN04489712_119109 [Thermomonospora echinospora]|uniref:Uncharacterized protein n=1 Tax=Thermomonospora echinospora TaxID=1992 RepID=A0A1H6DP62_9ACTN|nr:DUF6271 family protein [Thermomonospora echinospora]SEG86553.1 hypothetical protein SAMN04489712_119109 [Thermomonospora echinospora]